MKNKIIAHKHRMHDEMTGKHSTAYDIYIVCLEFVHFFFCHNQNALVEIVNLKENKK